MKQLKLPNRLLDVSLKHQARIVPASKRSIMEMKMLNKINAMVRRTRDLTRARRTAERLLAFDDRLLRDMGVRRHEILAGLAGL